MRKTAAGDGIKKPTAQRSRRARVIAEDGPHPLDVHVGGRIRLRRKMLGLSQQHLADSCDVSFQQVQKYERGANRVSASKLHLIAKALAVPVPFLFEGYDDPDPAIFVADDPLYSTENLRLLAMLARFEPAQRRAVIAMVETFGGRKDEQE